MKQFFGALLLAVCLVAAGVLVALADEGILVLPDGRAKYFKDGQFVSFVRDDGKGNWHRADTGVFIGRFFDDAKEPSGVYRDVPAGAAKGVASPSK